MIADDDACAPETVTSADGATLTACAHGGHVLGWTPAGGVPRLWLSPTARCGAGQAIRGGIPVIFPQFAGRGPLPKHGLARDRAWTVVSSGTTDGGRIATWRARLEFDDDTLAIWPHPFALELTVEAAGGRLDTTLTVRNGGAKNLSFSAALHTYLALGDPGATVTGLGGRTADDNADPGSTVTLGAPGEALAATQTRDVAVTGAEGPLVLDDPVLGRLEITAQGFGDRVMWNPGPGHGLADVPEGDERNFVCIEPAALEAVTLSSGGVWSGLQTLRVIS